MIIEFKVEFKIEDDFESSFKIEFYKYFNSNMIAFASAIKIGKI